MSGWNEATEAQVRAARPDRSSWVSANAGSGKTRVLTDRVARLLIRGVDPRRILCLTYTKAAAAEMQNRLFKRLGAWAMLPDDALRAALAELDEDAAGIEDPDLAAARRLFAAALEVPGGLKIQTIHSFCDSLLRRFPLEAGLSPDFQVMEGRQAAQLRQQVLEELADDPASGLADFVPHILTSEHRITKLLEEILRHRDRFGIDPEGEALVRAFGLEAPPPPFATVFTPGELATLAQAHDQMKGVRDRARLPALQAIAEGADDAAILAHRDVFLKDDGTPRSGLLSKGLLKVLPEAEEKIGRLQDAFVAFEDQARATAALAGARALIRFGARFLSAYDAAKRVRGVIDFDDLISLTGDLLTAREASAWVSYKLDGGIDHVLVDEAQDTSPGQWRVVDALVREFHAGEGQRARPGTLFVVGDPKQSIYSFQGAAPAAFGEQQGAYAEALAGVSRTLEVCDLLFSFRSSPVILDLVDAVIAQAGAGVDTGAGHRAFHGDLPGRVELWPLVPVPDAAPQPDPWDPGIDPTAPEAGRVLADQVAAEVAQMVRGDTALPGTGRAVQPGDILILVRSRNEIFRRVIRQLKAEGVPVAGADRLKVLDELAVRDLKALLAAVASPADELSLAAALRSPIFGLSEQDLFTLARGREAGLAEVLLATDSPAAALLADLRDRADFLRPYELLDRVLTRHGARARLVARLGPEADDAVEALLDLALDYEQLEPPTLTGFLDWLEMSDAERKRQMETGRGEVRVMTVHGAKGLEAPVVILPDTTRAPSDGAAGGALCPLGARAIALSGNQKTRPQVLAAEALRARALEREEHNRLLYVAMTRAERWLIVCGAARKQAAKDLWYDAVAAGMEALGAELLEDGRRRLDHAWTAAAAQGHEPGGAAPALALPDWARQTPAAPPAPQAALTPSDHGETLVPSGGGGGVDPETARRRGVLLHALLEHLPDLPEAQWAARSAELLAEASDEAEATALMAAAQRVLGAPELAWVFGPGSRAEQEIRGRVAVLGGRLLRARADRLVLKDGVLWVVDFKSDAAPPPAGAPVPEVYLRQLALYVAALGEAAPEQPVRAAILWTQAARLSALDPEDVKDMLQSFAPH